MAAERACGENCRDEGQGNVGGQLATTGPLPILLHDPPETTDQDLKKEKVRGARNQSNECPTVSHLHRVTDKNVNYNINTNFIFMSFKILC